MEVCERGLERPLSAATGSDRPGPPGRTRSAAPAAPPCRVTKTNVRRADWRGKEWLCVCVT